MDVEENYDYSSKKQIDIHLPDKSTMYFRICMCHTFTKYSLTYNLVNLRTWFQATAWHARGDGV